MDGDLVFPDVYLPDEFIEKYADKLCWTTMSHSRLLSENIVRKFADRIDWAWVKRHFHNYSEEFVAEMQMKGYC